VRAGRVYSQSRAHQLPRSRVLSATRLPLCDALSTYTLAHLFGGEANALRKGVLASCLVAG